MAYEKLASHAKGRIDSNLAVREDPPVSPAMRMGAASKRSRLTSCRSAIEGNTGRRALAATNRTTVLSRCFCAARITALPLKYRANKALPLRNPPQERSTMWNSCSDGIREAADANAGGAKAQNRRVHGERGFRTNCQAQGNAKR